MQQHADLFPSSDQQHSDPQWRGRYAERWIANGVHPEWVSVLLGAGPPLACGSADQQRIVLDAALGRVGGGLRERGAAGERILPDPAVTLRALAMAPGQVKVLIVGQDPYPTPGHGIGLSFATERDVRPLPRSLQNIRQELATDLGTALPPHGDLSPWLQQGVMLLNRTLTVTAGEAGSHAKLGWAPLTDAIVAHLGSLPGAPVGILWGKHAQAVRPLLGQHPVIESAHPSPLSARRGFFGSHPFSRANSELANLGVAPVDWGLGS